MLFSLPSVSNDVLGSKVIYCSSILCSVIFSGGRKEAISDSFDKVLC